MSDTDALLFANEVFYRAFADRNMKAMAEIWVSDAPCTCIHPGWHPLESREEILESWQAIFNGPAPPPIQCLAARGFVTGKTGVVLCYEKIGEDYLIASNVFTRRGAIWLLLHHQSGPVEGPPEENPAPQPPSAMN